MAGRRRVIVGVNGSVRSLQALRHAAAEARTRDAVLVAVHAWLPSGVGLAETYWLDPLLQEMWSDAAWQLLWGTFDAAFGGMPPDVEVETVVMRGEPRHVLAGIAARDDDLLVIGAGRRGIVRRLWRAGIAQYCIASARCPVLVVPPTALARKMDRPLHACLIIRRARTPVRERSNCPSLGPACRIRSVARAAARTRSRLGLRGRQRADTGRRAP